jgi:hypothetical protein
VQIRIWIPGNSWRYKAVSMINNLLDKKRRLYALCILVSILFEEYKKPYLFLFPGNFNSSLLLIIKLVKIAGKITNTDKMQIMKTNKLLKLVKESSSVSESRLGLFKYKIAAAQN